MSVVDRAAAAIADYVRGRAKVIILFVLTYAALC